MTISEPGGNGETSFHLLRATASPLDAAKEWTFWDARWAGRLLILGGLWPLIATSYLMQKQDWVWPWNLLAGCHQHCLGTRVSLPVQSADNARLLRIDGACDVSAIG